MHFDTSKNTFIKIATGVGAVIATVTVGYKLARAEMVLTQAEQVVDEVVENRKVIQEINDKYNILAKEQRLLKLHNKNLLDRLNKKYCLESNKPEDC